MCLLHGSQDVIMSHFTPVQRSFKTPAFISKMLYSVIFLAVQCVSFVHMVVHPQNHEDISFHSSVAGKKRGKSPFETHGHIQKNIIMFVTKIPIATSAEGSSMRGKDAPHFNNTAERKAWQCHDLSRNVVPQKRYTIMQDSHSWEAPDKQRDPRFPLQSNWICLEHEISWTICLFCLSGCYMCWKELAGRLFACQL